MEPFRLIASKLFKSYGELDILNNINFTLESGHTYCLMGPSGCGKTTLLRILLNLESADEGRFWLETEDGEMFWPDTVSGARFWIESENGEKFWPDPQKGSRKCRLTLGDCKSPDALPLVAVFQENRLCDSFSPLDNVLLAVKNTMSRETVYRELCRLLPEESILRPAGTLSGGMKRRVAILRALLAPSCGILMDEPFTGLDEGTKSAVISYINEKTAGKLLLVTTHQEEDIPALNGELLRLF